MPLKRSGIYFFQRFRRINPAQTVYLYSMLSVEMVHIKLIENSDAIDHRLYQEVFRSRLHALEKVLHYFERYQIEAVIKFEGRIHERRLQTSVEVECEDDVFKKVIEQSVHKFRQTAI